MRRTHRRFHRLIWPLLAVALFIGVTAALILRPPPKSATIAPAAAVERA